MGSTHFVIPNRRGAAVRACPERPSVARKSNGNPLLVAVILALSTIAPAQAKRPFTFEDMMQLKRVADPQVSPDGKWVIFSVADVDLAANTKTPHIWIVPTAGGEEREIIADQDADRPRWAPDGKRFAFISTKGGGSQVWSADFDSAAGTVSGTHQVTNIATEAGGELWSPDGDSLIFTSDVYPECDAPAGIKVDPQEVCNEMKLKEKEDSKVKAQVFTHLLYRHWNAYKEGRRTHIFVVGTAPCEAPKGPGVIDYACPWLFPLDLTPGDYDAPVFSLGGQDDYAFSPDGKEVCYTSNHDKNPAASTNNDLWIVPVTGGPAKNITADNPASDSTPLYSPDGRYIAYRAQQRPGDESDRFRLMLYDRKTGEKKNLTEDFDQWAGTYVWSSDSKTIYFGSEHKGESPIYRLPLGDPGAIAEIAPLAGYDDDLDVTPDGKSIFFTHMSLKAPNEIYRADLPTGEQAGGRGPNGEFMVDLRAGVAHVTHLNREVLNQIDMQAIEPFWFTGAHGDKVEGFLVKPPDFDASKKYPVKFLIHGGPEGAWGDDWSYRWNPELFASPTSSTPSGYVVIMINFHGSTGYGQKFIDAINGDWGGAPFEDLMKGLDYAEQTYPFVDKNRECALGASYGGYMANWVLGHTDRFKCIVSHDGMFNAESAWGDTEELWFNDWEFKGTPYDNRELYRKWSPHEYAKNFKTPTLVIHGQKDYRLDVSQGFDLFTTLQMEGIPSEMLYFPDEGHWVLKPQNSQLWYKTVNAWVDRWIGK
jgi:dipeptidyl aminopeptidase/acylaminoacyl peptidase